MTATPRWLLPGLVLVHVWLGGRPTLAAPAAAAATTATAATTTSAASAVDTNPAVFRFAATVTIEPGSHRAGLVFAAHDSWLADRNRHSRGLPVGHALRHVEVELDVTRLTDGSHGDAAVNVYRVDHAGTGRRDPPLRHFLVRRDILDEATAHQPHRLEIRARDGVISMRLDGWQDFFVVASPGWFAANGTVSAASATAAGRVDLEPPGEGGKRGKHVTRGNWSRLGDIGFAAGPGGQVIFTAVTVSDGSGDTLFAEDLGHAPYRGIFRRFTADASSGLQAGDGQYVADGGSAGRLWTARPGS